MNKRVRVLIITSLLPFLGFTNLKAVTEEISDPEAALSATRVDNEEATNILTTYSDTNELTEKEYLFYDSSLNEIRLSKYCFQDKYSLDSINTEKTKNYIFDIFPLIRKIDSKSIELIEIL